MRSKSPNILFLFTDQQRYDTVAALGNPTIKTPNLDRVVREGTAFTHAYSPSPECVPARCSMTYGQHACQTKCYANGHDFPFESKETFMTALGRQDYRSHGIGKYHFAHKNPDLKRQDHGFQTREQQEELVPDPENDHYQRFLSAAGYDHLTDPHGVRGDMYYFPQPAQMPAKFHPTQWVGDRSINFIQEQANEDKPWYCYTSFIHPHPPFCPPVPWHKLYREQDVPLPHLPPGYDDLLIWVNRFQNRYKRFDQGLDLWRVRMMRAYYYACFCHHASLSAHVDQPTDRCGRFGENRHPRSFVGSSTGIANRRDYLSCPGARGCIDVQCVGYIRRISESSRDAFL